MAREEAYLRHCLDLLAPLGEVSARSMFGGHGFYLDGVMFALISGGQLYFKVDELSRAAFAAADTQPFVYQGKTKPVTLSYCTAPPDAMEDPDSLLPWAEMALAAAKRAPLKKERKRRRKS